MRKAIFVIMILLVATSTVTARVRTIHPIKYDFRDEDYEDLMKFINLQIEDRNIRGSEKVEERKKQRRAFLLLTKGERKYVKDAIDEVCTKDRCDYAEALFQYQMLMDED